MEATPTRPAPPPAFETPLPYRPPPMTPTKHKGLFHRTKTISPPPSPVVQVRKRGPRMSRTQEIGFALRELWKTHEDVYHDYVGDERRVRYLLATWLGPKYQRQLRIGRLHVRLIEAANLPAADLGGTSDPYVVATLTGWNKYGDEWSMYGWRDAQTSCVKPKTLSPRWYEDKYFAVPRHDAWLRVEVFDKDNQSTDDLLGSVEIQLKDLSHVGAVKRWFPLSVPGHSDTAAAIHLYLHYDVSALGEALSMVWAEQPKATNKTPFDANRFYANAIELQKELEPYLQFASSLEKVLAWKSDKSRRYFILALIVAYFVDYFCELVHLSIILLLVRNLQRKRFREHIRTEAKHCFAKVDNDGGGTLDRKEIGLAIAQLAVRRKTSPPPTEEIDKLFAKADVDKGGSLDLNEFAQLCLDSPSLMGLDVSEDDEEEYEGDAETERLLRGSPKKKPLVKLPSFRASHSQEEEDIAHDKKKGPFHGMTKKVVNLAANKAGKAPAKMMLKLGATASDVRKLRDLFNWEDFAKTLGFLLVNLVAVVLHFYLPIRYFAIPVVIGMFFVLSEKSKAIERIACHALSARKRYVHLRRLKKGYDEPTSPLLRLPTARPVPQHKKSHLPSFGRGHNRQLVKSVVRGIFSRLDDDASGSVDGRELISFVEEALPRATPRAVAKLGGDAATAKLAVERLVQKFDVNGGAAASVSHQHAIAATRPNPHSRVTVPRAGDGQIDRTEFESIVQKSGCVDVLTQDELRRQLTAEGGLHCSKRPSHEAHFPMTASHTTSLNVQASNKKVDGYRIHKLVWTTVKGETKSADDVKRVVASMTAPSVLLVHRASTAPLQFDVGVFFRDPLVDLLTMLCTGRPLEAGKALEPSRIDALKIRSPSSRALRLEDSDGEIGEDF